jgi:hypothetical protein
MLHKNHFETHFCSLRECILQDSSTNLSMNILFISYHTHLSTDATLHSNFSNIHFIMNLSFMLVVCDGYLYTVRMFCIHAVCGWTMMR